VKLGQLAPYEIADRLSLPTVLQGVSHIEAGKISRFFKISLSDLSPEELKKYRDKYRAHVPDDSTSLLKLIDAAYAKSLKIKADEKATLDKYLRMRDIQSGFDAGA
jgi:hypothetical protein